MLDLKKLKADMVDHGYPVSEEPTFDAQDQQQYLIYAYCVHGMCEEQAMMCLVYPVGSIADLFLVPDAPAEDDDTDSQGDQDPEDPPKSQPEQPPVIEQPPQEQQEDQSAQESDKADDEAGEQ